MVGIPSFSQVEQSFGVKLRKARGTRGLSEQELAEKANAFYAAESERQRQEIDVKRAQYQQQLAELQEKLDYQQSAQAVTAKLIREWEAGNGIPTDVQYINTKEALNSVLKLSDEEIEALEHAFDYAKRHVARGDKKTAQFGETIKEIIFSRMEHDDTLTYKALAQLIAIAGDPGAPTKLTTEIEAIAKNIAELPVVTPKDFFLVDGTGEKKSLNNKDGGLQLRESHIRQIEHGIIPSPDIYATLKRELFQPVVDANERAEADRAYAELLDNAPAVVRKIIQGSAQPETPEAPASTPPAAHPEDKVAPPVQETEKPVEVTPAVPAIAVAATVAAPILVTEKGIAPPMVETPVVKEASKPMEAMAPIVPPAVDDIIRFEPSAAPAAVSPTPPAQFRPPVIIRGVNNPVDELAKAYVAIFSAFGHEAPTNTGELTSRHDNSGGARANIAGNLPRPFSLTPLAEKSIRGLVAAASDKEQMQELCDDYNRLSEQVHAQILNSQQGQELRRAQKVLENALDAEPKGRQFKDLKKIDNLTGILQKDFEDYFMNGGLRMSESPEVRTALSRVNQKWFENDGRQNNPLRHNNQTWKSEAANYIAAHQAVQALHATQQLAFEKAASTYVDEYRQKTVINQEAADLVALRAEQTFAQRFPKDPDFRMLPDSARKLAQLNRRTVEDKNFAEAVRKAEAVNNFREEEARKKRAPSANGADRPR